MMGWSLPWGSVIAAVLLTAIGAGGATGQDPARSFAMGMAYWPPFGGSTPEDVLRSDLDKLLPNTDAVLVQVPWCPGVDLSDAEWMASVARGSNKQLVLAVDWLVGARRDVRCGETRPWTFANRETAAAFQETIVRLAVKYRPQYLLLGVEVDYYAVFAPADFPHFLAAYRRTREEVAAVSPDTKVGVSLQYEHMMRTPGGREPFVDAMILAFEGMSDFIGLATYPFIAGITPPEVNARYFEAMSDLSIPIAVMETGWPSADTGLLGIVAGLIGHRSQEPYLRALLQASQDLEASIVIWASMRDVGLTVLDKGTPPWAAFLGLWNSEGNPKAGLDVWQAWRGRAVQGAARDG